MKRTVIIGLDGVPFGLLKDLSEKGVMPNVKEIISKGTFKKMRSSVPDVSSVAWSSVITGANPAQHGIFGFTDLAEGSYRLTFPNFNNLKREPFWHRDKKSRHAIINVPSTYPAKELNGVLISGFVALDLERAVYPSSLTPVLKDMEYRVDVDSAKAHQSMDLFIKDLNRTNEARISLYRHLWDEAWKTFMLVFTGTDRLMHFLWDACEDEDNVFHKEFNNYFRRIDEVIGEIAGKMNGEDDLIMLSDHGFERLKNDVYINCILKNNGFLKLKDDKTVSFTSIDYGTKAFALDPARIYINMKGRYPRGSVAVEEREKVLRDVEGLFKNFEIGNKRVIKHIYRKEEVYDGPYLDQAPDLVLIGNKGFNLKAAVNSEKVYSSGIFTGKHTEDNAFLLIDKKIKDDIIPASPEVSDIVGIMDRLQGD